MVNLYPHTWKRRRAKISAGPPPSVFDKTSLISWWDLEEESGTRNDAHGTNHLTDNNTLGYTTGVVGDATDHIRTNVEYLSIVDNASLSMGVGVHFTFGCWFYLDGNQTGNSMLMGKFGTAGDYAYLLWSDNSPTMHFSVSSTGSDYFAINQPVVSIDNWRFAIAWYDGTNINLQIDEGTIYQTAFNLDVYDDAAAFELGNYAAENNTGNNLNGRMDSAFLFKRVLSADERTWLYNGGAGRQYSDL